MIFAFIFIGGVIGGYYFLKKFGEAFGAECELTKEWTFQEYDIREYRCLGWAGPPWYPIDIYRDGKEITTDEIRKDSCLIRFRRNKQQYVDLDICRNLVSTITVDKELLKPYEIDSVLIYSKSLDEKKFLNKKKIEQIVQDWNNSEIRDYRDKPFDSIFYPDYNYKLFIYRNGKEMEFITGSYIMAGKDKWTFEMTPEREMDYFDNIWNGK